MERERERAKERERETEEMEKRTSTSTDRIAREGCAVGADQTFASITIQKILNSKTGRLEEHSSIEKLASIIAMTIATSSMNIIIVTAPTSAHPRIAPIEGSAWRRRIQFGAPLTRFGAPLAHLGTLPKARVGGPARAQ